jgi:hypothetical protein
VRCGLGGCCILINPRFDDSVDNDIVELLLFVSEIDRRYVS